MVNLFSLKNKNIILTGSTGYIGSCLAQHLEAEGAHLIKVSRNEKMSDLSYSLDLRNDEKRKQFIDFVVKQFGTVDGLINNAYSGATNTVEATTRKVFEDSVDITLTTPFLLIKELLPYFTCQSSIVNIASMYGMVSPDPRVYGNSGQNNPVYYGAGKAGLIQMTKYLACHLVEKGIRVNAVSPGAFPNLEGDEKLSDFHKKIVDKIPLGRIGSPEELCGPVQFLLSDASSYITGSNVCVDGGWTAW